MQVHRLTDIVGLEETPAISPDGKSIAFVAEVGGRRQIWLRLLAGGTPLAITKDDVDHYGPRWSPDSASLIYYTAGSAQPGEPGTIWEISALGGTPQRLVNALGPGDLSHDGKNLAFFRFSRARSNLPSLHATDPRPAPSPNCPARSTTIHVGLPMTGESHFTRNSAAPTSGVSLLVQDLSGGEPQRVLDASQLLQGFAWTPDGSGLIVSSAQGSTMTYPPSYNFWMVPLGRGAPVQLTFGETSYESPDVGRDGRVVVSRVRAQSDIWKFPIDR